MEKIKIFLASSSELKDDRQQFEIFINRKNKEWAGKGVFLELVVWEDFLDAVSRTRLQDEYNKAIRQSHIFVMLFFTKVGKFTEEEFETAFGHFKATNKPLIFTYFKDAPITTGSASDNKKDLMSLWAFQEKLSALGHFYTKYTNTDQLLLKFHEQLDKLSEDGFIKFKSQKEEKKAGPTANLTRLPIPTTKLVGRKKRLKELDEAFENPKISIVSIIAPGGVGKSAIADEWLDRLAPGYGGAEKVFGWSFYSQGSHQTSTNSTAFFGAALPFFGWEGDPPSSEDAKALADLISRQPSLLVLDGIEPLQHNPKIQHGWVADTGLKHLLTHVGRNGLAKGGLILVSSRQPVIELEKHKGKTYIEIDLETLSPEEGAELLESLGVKRYERAEGFKDELIKTSREFGGHALALVLLGNLIAREHDGDLREKDRIPSLFMDADQGGHAMRVMRQYEDLWTKDSPDILFLKMLGLFDRPMGEGEREVLFQKAGFARPLAALKKEDRNAMADRLKKAGLLLETPDALHRKEWDAHPLVRSWFGERFKEGEEEKWREAHKILFEYFQSMPEKKQPDTPEELVPLYRAMAHGCLAGEYKKAREDVYRDRILRGNEHYSIHKLGLYAQDLAAISGFFPEGWDRPVSSGLSEADQGWLLQAASFCLMSLGRMQDAVTPRRSDMYISEKLEDWEGVSSSAGSLVDLLVPTGGLAEALEAAGNGIEWAGRRKEDKFRQMSSQAKLAIVHLHLGNLDRSLEIFKEVERTQEEFQKEYPRLYSIYGAQHCALLLERGEAAEALDRGRYGLKISEGNNWFVDMALDHLTLGRSLETLGKDEEAGKELNLAVEGMKKAGSVMDMPLVLLARAAFFLRRSNIDAARRDLDEAMEIAERCGMALYEAEGLLAIGQWSIENCQLSIENDKADWLKEAKEAAGRAEEMIYAMKYGLRYAEVDLLKSRLASAEGNKHEAERLLDKAWQRAKEIGQLRIVTSDK